LQKVGGLVRLEAFLFEEGFDALPLGQAHHGEASGDFAGVEAIATEGLAGMVARWWLGGWGYIRGHERALAMDRLGFEFALYAVFFLLVLPLLWLFVWSVIKLFDAEAAVRKKGLTGFCVLALLLAAWALLANS
jgi:hypothetical protein